MNKEEQYTFDKIADQNKKLRELLWLNHGCPVSALYGDDGEMQCGKCYIDFKRDSAERIEEVWVQRGMRAMGLTEILDCGCTVVQGRLCPIHGCLKEKEK